MSESKKSSNFFGTCSKPDRPVLLNNLVKPNCPGAQNARVFSLFSLLGMGYHALMFPGANLTRREKSKCRWLNQKPWKT